MAWLRQLLDWQRETQDPGEFLDSLRFDLHAQEVFVFTPKGDVIALPASATPVDFAYAVHTEVGHRCIGARVNGRLVPLESVLDNGDVVEVFTSKSESAGPSRDWLAFVKSPRARNKIRQWFAKERREDAIDQGKDAISRAMRKAGLPLQRLMGGDALLTLAHDLRYADVSALYAAVGEGHVSAQSVVQRLVHALGGPEGAVEDIAETETATRVGNRPRPAGDPGVVVKGERTSGRSWPLLHAGAGRRDPRLRHPRARRLGAPGGLLEREQPVAPSPIGWSRSSGRRPPVRCSWWRSRSRRSTATGCSRT